MDHNEYTRINNSDTAVLMVHGILGTPRHFDSLISAFPEEWDIYNILLDGHGKGVSDFSNTSMKKWEKQVDETVCSLCGKYENIVILAHSMGTLLAISSTLKKPKKIRGLILLDVPLRMHLMPKAAVNALKVVFGKVSENDIEALATKNACSISTTKQLWKYIGWIPRYLELFKLAENIDCKLKNLKLPCCIFQSRHDELVSLFSLEPLKKIENANIKILSTSGHFCYSKSDTEFLRKNIQIICKKINQRKEDKQ